MDDAMGGALPASQDMASPAVAKPVATKRINLALQGGGTHGAFTWGVLERLAEDDRLVFDGVSGASAGAINAALFVQGLADGGPQGAIAALGKMWREVADGLARSPMRNTPIEKALWGHDMTYSLAYQAFETLTRVFSPYQINPFAGDFNPLRKVVDNNLDWQRLRTDPKAIRFTCRHSSSTVIAPGQGMRPPVRPNSRICPVVTSRPAKRRRMASACWRSCAS